MRRSAVSSRIPRAATLSRGAFTLPELLAALALIAILSTLSLPAWRSLISSSAAKVGASLVMDSLAAARAQAVSSGTEVWMVMRYGNRTDGDAIRLISRNTAGSTPIGGWSRLPSGVTFGGENLADSIPPAEICLAASTGGSAPPQGGIMFLRSGGVGWPKAGGAPLVITLRSGTGVSRITLSRGTGKAVLSPGS